MGDIGRTGRCGRVLCEGAVRCNAAESKRMGAVPTLPATCVAGCVANSGARLL
jgi:hypothetical protein